MQELELYRDEEDAGGIGAEEMRSCHGVEETEADKVLHRLEEDAEED